MIACEIIELDKIAYLYNMDAKDCVTVLVHGIKKVFSNIKPK